MSMTCQVFAVCPEGIIREYSKLIILKVSGVWTSKNSRFSQGRGAL